MKPRVAAACVAAFAAILLGRPGNLHAAPEIWELQDVTFSDGATAKGWLRIDLAAAPGEPVLLDWDVTTSGGDSAKFETLRYVPSSSGGAAGHSSLTLHSRKSFGAGRNNFRVLCLTFSEKTSTASHAKNPRHAIELISNRGDKPASYEDVNATGTFRLLTAGHVVIVARPSASATEPGDDHAAESVK